MILRKIIIKNLIYSNFQKLPCHTKLNARENRVISNEFRHIICAVHVSFLLVSRKRYEPTDRRTDRRTHPLIEIRGRYRPISMLSIKSIPSRSFLHLKFSISGIFYKSVTEWVTDRRTDGPTDRPTQWLIESRARD